MSYVDRGYYRNVVRNGDMGVAQRGNGPISTVQVYTVDGWGNGGLGGTTTINRVVTAPGLGSNQLSVTTSGHAAAGDYSVPYQGIEDVNTLNGASSVLSFDAKAASGTPKVVIELTQMCGTGGSGDFINTFGPVTLSTTMTRYIVPITLPSTVGKTVGANNQLRLHFWVSAGSTYAARTLSIGIQNNTFYFTDIQLEAGFTATAFERIPQAMQWDWNRRYFQRWYQPPLRGVATSATAVGRMGMALGTTMRAVPSATMTGALPVYDGAGTGTVTALGTSYCTPQSLEFDHTVSGGLTAGRPGIIYQNSPTTNYIDLSAEL